MTPPNMLLPNFSPIQDHMPLPTLTASTFIPPQTFLKHQVDRPPSVIKYSRLDPTLLVMGISFEEPDEPRPVERESSIIVFKAADVEREVRGDREIVAGPANELRMKIRPSLQQMAEIHTSSAVLDIQFSPHDPELLVATLSTGVVNFYRIRYGTYRILQLSAHTLSKGTPINAFAFSPTNPSLAAVALSNGSVGLLSIPSDPRSNDSIEVLNTLQGHSAPVLRCIFSVDGKRLYTAAEDGTLISWSTTNPRQSKIRWQDTSTHRRGITSLMTWPAPGAADIRAKRRALLTGSYDHMFRVLDMSGQNRPPMTVQDIDLKGVPWRLSPLPPLPTYKEIKKLGAGVFSADANPNVELDKEIGGLLAAAGKGGARVLIHKQKFEDVFLPRRDGSDIIDWKTSDGVLMDHEGREKKYYWYDLADIEEHGDARVCATDAVAVIDYDPLFRDSGKQRLRRGWRLCSVDREGVMHFWQVYIE